MRKKCPVLFDLPTFVDYEPSLYVALYFVTHVDNKRCDYFFVETSGGVETV